MVFKYSDYNITPTTKCAICEETAREIRKQYGDDIFMDSTFSEKLDGAWICFPCRESTQCTPQGTILIFNPQNRTVEKYIIMEHEDVYGIKNNVTLDELEDLHIDIYDNEQCPIQFSYHKTDAWRGYYQPQAEDWKDFHSDCILSYSEDARQLKEFDTDIKRILWELGFEFAVCFGRTSNVFSCGYDILIKKTDEEEIIKTTSIYMRLLQLRTKYRDNERFTMTALTGKSEGFNKKDKLLAEAFKRLKKGEDFETIKEDIMQRV